MEATWAEAEAVAIQKGAAAWFYERRTCRLYFKLPVVDHGGLAS